MSFGDWLKKERAARNLTQRALSRIANGEVSAGMIARLEGDDVGYSQAMVVRIADALSGPEADEDERELLRREALAASVGLDQELEAIPDDETLQSQILGYTGSDPILRSAAATARGVQEALLSAAEMQKKLDSAEEIPEGESVSTSKIRRRRA